MSRKDTSKFISLILRHKPEIIEISLDEHGWANVKELIAGIVKTEPFDKWCTRKGHNFSQEKALDLYASSCGHFTALPKNANTKLLVTTAAQQLIAAKTTLVAMRMEMLRLARQLPRV